MVKPKSIVQSPASRVDELLDQGWWWERGRLYYLLVEALPGVQGLSGSNTAGDLNRKPDLY